MLLHEGKGPLSFFLQVRLDSCALNATQCPPGHCLNRDQASSFFPEWFAGVSRGVIHSSHPFVQPVIFANITRHPGCSATKVTQSMYVLAWLLHTALHAKQPPLVQPETRSASGALHP
mmetsp:Transcript_67159/g.132430  ORF Transcript_67159/g.132430 Transcript_67159/m.132430 type:complete len:118 (+) Transcript_67159:2497-2850(+)